MGGPSGGLAFEVKGFPGVLFTSASYKNLSGYFGEFKAEYSGAVVGNLSGSFFLKGDVIHASFTDLTNFTSLFSVNSVIPPGSSPLPVTNSGAEVATSIHWQQLSVGGSLILNF
jgi:hypothetical protein